MKINSHVVSNVVPADRAVIIETIGEAEASGAFSAYRLTLDNSNLDVAGVDSSSFDLKFQSGTIPEAGANGVTNEALLAIVEHRLECFQAGPFFCDENAKALQCVTDALDWLKSRTKRRREQGIEGAHIENREAADSDAETSAEPAKVDPSPAAGSSLPGVAGVVGEKTASDGPEGDDDEGHESTMQRDTATTDTSSVASGS